MELLEKYLQLLMTTALDSTEEIAVKVVNRQEEHLALHLPCVLKDEDRHFPVIFIGGWYYPKDKPNSYFNGYPAWETFSSDPRVSAVELAIYRIKQLFEKHGKEWGEEFSQKFGDGYDGCFTKHDGIVSPGYELRACDCFPQWLAISLVHIYYGK
jgi:hypothetical protein